MFIAVLSGYIMASIMAFCGIFNIINYFSGDLQGAGAAAYVQGLAMAAWPLAVAVTIFTLVQIAVQLEKLAILSSMGQSGVAVPAPQAAKKQETAKTTRAAVKKALTRSFFHIEPTSVPASAHEFHTDPEADDLHAITEVARHADSTRVQEEPLHPEQIPAWGSTPSQEVETTQYPDDAGELDPGYSQEDGQEQASEQPEEEQRKAPDPNEGLSFFRVN